MVKTIKEETAGASAQAAVPKEWWSGDIRSSSGPAYGRHMTPPRALPPLPVASLRGPFLLPEGRPPTGP